MNYEKEYEKMKKWASSKGYSVSEEYHNEDSVCFDSKTIYINSRQSIENMLYGIVHEAGHILIFSSMKHFLDKHPIYPYDIMDGRVKRSKKYSVCLVSEEIEAWKKGLGLAKRLKININKEKYFKIMVESVWSYIDYVR
jgi:hypothetical protein